MANLADPLRAPLELPCGKTLGTRIIKGATTEYSADEYGCANEKHVRLYSAWAANDFGIQIVGQFMVDHRYMEAATNVVIDDKSPHTMAPAHLDTLKRVASARNGGSSPDNQLMVVQLSHPGRQSRPICSTESIGVSPDKPVLLFGAAVAPLRKEALSVKEIDETIHKYVHAATTLQACGFDGVQIHCGHGYLGHQFLSPITNVRTDAYGGSVEKRAKWICDLCDAMRAACGPKFVIGVRISAQDFEPGGNTAKDTAKVCAMLDARKVDFIEVSGGSSENLVPLCGTYMSRDYRPRLWNYVKYCLVFLAFCTALLVPLALGFLALAFYLHLNPGVPPEGWFLADALEIKRLAKPKHTKIGTVGGFYTRHAMEDALKKGVDFVSVCSTIVYDPVSTRGRKLETANCARFLRLTNPPFASPCVGSMRSRSSSSDRLRKCSIQCTTMASSSLASPSRSVS